MSNPDFPDDFDTGAIGRPQPENTTALRDWFAGQALRAVIDTDGYEIAEGREILARNCYRIADAMLAARKRKP